MNARKKILVVDDEESLRNALKEKLEKESYEVLMAGNGEEGLEIALRELPDLTLLDLDMPKMNGTAMLKHLRADARGKALKVIVLTNVTNLDEVATVMEDDGTAYLIKTDTNLEVLIEHVRDTLGAP
jgi:DNA-binding response OmpR family regulator